MPKKYYLHRHFLIEPSPRVAVFELLFAALIWGFGFIAVKWTLESAGPFWIAAIRFLLAFILGGLLVFIPSSLKKSKIAFSDFGLACLPGLLLAVTLILQTAGLNYTTVTNSGFITTLYALLVPFIEFVFFRKKITKAHLFYLVLALWGTIWISQFDPLSGKFNFGDGLTLICAFASAFHMTYISKISKQISSAFTFNIFQSLWAGLISLFCALFFDPHLSWPFTAKASLGFLFLSLGSTLFAFYIQVRAQKVLSAALASLLFLMESPFAAVLAFFFLGEKLTPIQWAGAGLILVSTILAARKAS